MKPSHSGILIAIEGIDGSGKSLLTSNLHTALHALNKPVLITKEPGGTPLGHKLYSECINSAFELTAQTEFLLFAASRAEHFDKVVIPHLKQNYIVISDRMGDSSLVYQGYARGLDLVMLSTINNWVMHTIVPDLTFYVRIDLATACQRIKHRNEKPEIFEQRQTFLEQSIAGFDDLYKDRADVVTLDGNQSPTQITQQALDHILTLTRVL